MDAYHLLVTDSDNQRKMALLIHATHLQWFGETRFVRDTPDGLPRIKPRPASRLTDAEFNSMLFVQCPGAPNALDFYGALDKWKCFGSKDNGTSSL